MSSILSSIAHAIGDIFNNIAYKLNRMTAQEAAWFGVGVVVAFVIFLQLTVSFYEAYMPSMLWAFLKFLVYLVLPLTAAFGMAFGAWIERKYVVYDDAYAFFANKFPSLGLHEE